jgi:osmotically-inducible protein OsmY
MPAPCRDGALLGILLAMLVLVVSCASAPGPLPAQTPDDVATSNRIYAALNADPIYYFRHVNVQVDDGVANLSGYVWSTDALYRARQIARGVPGIARVVSNQLELEREGRDNGIAR